MLFRSIEHRFRLLGDAGRPEMIPAAQECDPLGRKTRTAGGQRIKINPMVGPGGYDQSVGQRRDATGSLAQTVQHREGAAELSIPANKWMKDHQMSINGKRKDIKKSDIIQVARNMNIKRPNDIIDHITQHVMKWSQYAELAKVNVNQIKAINKTFLFL